MIENERQQAEAKIGNWRRISYMRSFQVSYSYLPFLNNYELAFCLSVHKSQGSEYDEVLFLVPKGSELFGREVLYTAVTRAKNKLNIDGNPEEIARALAHSTLKPSGLYSASFEIPFSC